jgi:hypothetical protein
MIFNHLINSLKFIMETVLSSQIMQKKGQP